MQLNDIRAVVTGGVSGLGFAVARHLVAAGAKVALFDVNDEKGAAGDDGTDVVELHGSPLGERRRF